MESMRYDEVRGVGKRVSRLVQGTIMLRSEELEPGLELLDAVYGLGCNSFDTAHVYGGGEGERVLGQWIESRGVRDEVVILTKGAHHNADRRRVTPFDIASDLHDSLARLRTDYVDLYLLHRDDPSVPVGPIVEALNEHVTGGRIRAFGGSNWSADRIRKANEYAEAHGLVPFSASSPHYSLAEQLEEPWEGCLSLGGEAGDADRAWYRETGMPLFCWSTLSLGFFSGRITRKNFGEIQEDLPESCVRAYCHERNFDRLDRVSELARAKGKTVPQIALAYVLNQPLNLFPLIGCASGEELQANLDAMGLVLTPEELAWIDLRGEKPS